MCVFRTSNIYISSVKMEKVQNLFYFEIIFCFQEEANDSTAAGQPSSERKTWPEAKRTLQYIM